MSNSHEAATGSLIGYLRSAVDSGIYTRDFCEGAFCGVTCILVQAGVEALRRSPDDRERFTEVVKTLLSRSPVVAKLHRGECVHDQKVREQGEHLFQGMCRTVLAGCTGRDLDFPLAVAAVADFDQAWPVPEATISELPPPLDRAGDDFGKFWESTRGRQGIGFWAGWDLLTRLRAPSAESPRAGTSSIPILLFGERGGSRAAELTVELIFDGGRGFRPDPFFLGLTALDEGEESFHQSMQRVWKRSGLDTRGCRGRWWVTAFQPPDTEEFPPFAVAVLSGRSAEAAACCALWAALGSIPGDQDEQSGQNFELDPLATISAQLADGSESGRAIYLEPVRGVPEKLKAARGAGLEMILLAGGQDPKDYADHHKERPGDPVLVQTAGEAFEHLLVYRRTLKNYQDHITRQWKEQWA